MEQMNDGQITLTALDGSEEIFYVMEKASIAGKNYLLVANSMEEEAEALILKEIKAQEEELTYEVLEDENEIIIISKYFEELLEDIDLEIE